MFALLAVGWMRQAALAWPVSRLCVTWGSLLKGNMENRILRLLFVVRLSFRVGWRRANEMASYRLCSSCFSNEGLRLSAEELGLIDNVICRNCGSLEGRKLTKDLIEILAYRFFVWGTLHHTEFGAAPLVQFNERRESDIDYDPPWPKMDTHLIEKTIGVGFFLYTPRLWMVGLNIVPLEELKEPDTRYAAIQRVVEEYPSIIFARGEKFYRLRKEPSNPTDINEYDSPGTQRKCFNRFDSRALPIMYAAQDLQICVHECRVTAEEEVFVATLRPTRDMKLLNLTEILPYYEESEFESLDMAVHMLFLAGRHSYEICRELALAAYEKGYDGLVYPSYYSLLRTGRIPFETSFGLSHRMFPQFSELEKSKIIVNLALFGHPVKKEDVQVQHINKLVLRRVEYEFHFGPVGI